MPYTFGGLNIATSALNLYQTGINTTAHNIANTDTRGYSRQEILSQAAKGQKINGSYGLAGTGVSVTGIDQIRDAYYDIRYWENNSLKGGYAMKENYLTQIESYFNEGNTDGLSGTYKDFYTALNDYAQNSSDITKRKLVADKGQNMTDMLNNIASRLKNLQETANSDIKTQTNRINSLSQSIADLNRQITTIESKGVKANDLRDQRANLVDDLSAIINVSVKETDLGNNQSSYEVKINGQSLVSDEEYHTLEAGVKAGNNHQSDCGNLYEIRWSNGEKLNLDHASGRLKSLLELRDGNNNGAFTGRIDTINGNDLTITSPQKDWLKLGIPESGTTVINNQEYSYSGFDLSFNEKGEVESYTLHLTNPPDASIKAGNQIQIGEQVNYRGIPYYQQQLNEYARTFANAFNDIHSGVANKDGTTSLDFFTTNDPNVFQQDILTENPKGTKDEFGVVTNQVISSSQMSYYKISAGNIGVNQEILSDSSKITIQTAQEALEGSEGHSILDQLNSLKDNKKLFAEGTGESYLASLVGDIGTQTQKIGLFTENQDQMIKNLETLRLSVSGVDKNEESANLLKMQNGYTLSAKMISVMNELFDTLINRMGV